jgi:hypothetical protein
MLNDSTFESHTTEDSVHDDIGETSSSSGVDRSDFKFSPQGSRPTFFFRQLLNPVESPTSKPVVHPVVQPSFTPVATPV